MVRLSLGLPLAGLLTSALATTPLPMRDPPPPSGQTCPESCHVAGYAPSNWTVVAHLDQLRSCPRPLLMDFSFDIPMSEKQFIRACDTWGSYYYNTPMPTFNSTSEKEIDHVVPQMAWSAIGNRSQEMTIRYQAFTAVKKIQSHLQRSPAAWNKTILFSSFGGATIGIYIGENMHNPSVANFLFKPFVDKLMTTGIALSKASLLQVCGQNRTGDRTFGIIAASNNMSTVQFAVKSWAKAVCVDTSGFAELSTLNSTSIRVRKLQTAVAPTHNLTTNWTMNAVHTPHLSTRGECRAISVKSGDSCGALATRCGISPNDFTKFNKDPKLCASLTPGGHVCCSAGTLPDFRPKPNSDGSCAVYQTRTGDNCATIAAANSLKKEDLESFNKLTWGWAGCDSLWMGVKMCISKGEPPMPAPIANAVCGPQKPNTPKPPKGSNISELNPCPLNTCCNIWGQCGTTEDFCLDTRGKGAPGTAKKGTFGCISNCGMDVVKSAPPAQYIKLGYFEAFNLDRACLNMDVRQIDSSYTHVHFAFALLSDKFEVYLQDNYQKYQFEQFKKIKSFKKILSFGGWAFSAERPYYTIFRNGVKAANRDRLASNIAKFINDNNLDGVDIDWEYPGAPDIPGIPPPDDPNEGVSYTAFLRVLKSKLNSGKSLSIAAPASYWYLKQFPIKDIAKVVDYIVYMTYDLHGQWDSGSKWANPGCPSGNCLRSHVNLTETVSALSLITKAGVPSNKVIVGVASYGRSYQMTDPSCTGPTCTFTGGNGVNGSGAKKGRCTATSGYISNAEIKEIATGLQKRSNGYGNGSSLEVRDTPAGMKGANGVKTWYDKDSDSNIMTYGDNWVAYMSQDILTRRNSLYKGYNTGGTTNWAVDLEKFEEPPNLIDGLDVKIGWDQLKQNIKNSGDATSCNNSIRTGTWVNHQCTENVVVYGSQYSPPQRWNTLECGAAWNDAKAYWLLCIRPKNPGGFGKAIAEFFHVNENSKCDDLGASTSCEPDALCTTHVSSADSVGAKSGAGSYLVWNSFAKIHILIKNYQDSLKTAANEIQHKRNEFLDTFAPEGHQPDFNLAIHILLSILLIPATSGGTVLWKGILAPAFKKGSLKLDTLKDTSQAIVTTSITITKLFFNKQTIKEVSFNLIFDKLIHTWAEQVDTLAKRLFNGEDESIKVLDKLMDNGLMLHDFNVGNDPEHTDSFQQVKAVKRLFYAAAIPAAWKVRKPYAQYPVVLDFGPDCNRDIGSDGYFHGGEDYNQGWVCLDGHNYILASTYTRDNAGPNCDTESVAFCFNSDYRSLFTLPGLDKIRKPDDKFGGVTVEDLVAGAVSTWKRAGKLNILDGSLEGINSFSKKDFDDLWDNDIRAPGAVHIPVCSVEEAAFLALDGTKNGLPESELPSFPCLRDPSKRYESNTWAWPMH